MAKVLVCGGRDFDDYTRLAVSLRLAARSHGEITEIIHGGARGADMLADRWAMDNRITCTIYHADWQKHGRKAGPLRNQRMLDDAKPDVVVAMPGGRGTADMVARAKAAGVPVIEDWKPPA
jgi:hypothetical protein